MSLSNGKDHCSEENMNIIQTQEDNTTNISAAPLLQYEFVSEVDKIRMLRDVYKKETAKSCEEILAQLEQEKHERLSNAVKAELLVDYNKNVLKRLGEQRYCAEKVLKETVSNAKLLTQRLSGRCQEKDIQTISLNKASIKKLLSELKS